MKIQPDNGQFLQVVVQPRATAAIAFTLPDGTEFARVVVTDGRVVDCYGNGCTVMLSTLTNSGVVRYECGHTATVFPHGDCPGCLEADAELKRRRAEDKLWEDG